MPFVHTTRIHFRDCDPAGILFAGQAMSLAHDATERFIEHLGIPWKTWFANPDFVVPIRHTETEFLAPMAVSAEVEAHLEVERLGSSSCTFVCTFMVDGRVCARTRTVHTFASKPRFEKLAIPEALREKLAGGLSGSSSPSEPT